eukprot:15975615-Heterocapsa_arctica.AAC.1
MVFEAGPRKRVPDGRPQTQRQAERSSSRALGGTPHAGQLRRGALLVGAGPAEAFRNLRGLSRQVRGGQRHAAEVAFGSEVPGD